MKVTLTSKNLWQSWYPYLYSLEQNSLKELHYNTAKAFFCPLKKWPKKAVGKELLSNEKGCKRLNHENDSKVVLVEIAKKFVKMRQAGSLVNASFSWRVYVFSSVLFCLTSVHSSNWQENIRPKLFAKLNSRDYQSFSGTIKVRTCFDIFLFLLVFVCFCT